MTPRQIHALEWAVEEMKAMRSQVEDLPDCAKVFDIHMYYARAAIAQAWHDYREQQSAARSKSPHRALQTVPR